MRFETFIILRIVILYRIVVGAAISLPLLFYYCLGGFGKLSEFGVKINNYQAGAIYDTNLGLREKYHTTPAMLTNSLFLDFLKENGLKVNKGGFSKDVICVQFDYGSDSYGKAIDKIKKAIDKNRVERKIAKSRGHKKQIEKLEEIKHGISKRRRHIEEKHDKFQMKSKQELRKLFYEEGITIKYQNDTIHYKMLYRTPGKAKKGTVMFIRDSLYNKAHKFLWMGLKLPKHNAPIVEISAYSSLITSTIEDKIKVEPENILILNDVESVFKTNVLSIETDDVKRCHAFKREDYEIKNVLFDGQSLIDESIFPSWGNGYVLLRQHFFKSAAFCSKIQKFFKDYYGDDYNTATVKDMFGVEHLVKDIKLITTDNSCKWLKFDISYEYWSERVWDNGAMFGIVKTAHKSKFGDVQRMSYQMVNSLDINTIDEVIKPTAEYIHQLKTNDEVFFDFLRHKSNFSNDCDVLIALCEHCPKFVHSEYFLERRQALINAYIKSEVKHGRIIQNGDNLVIVGNPYAMLLHAVGENPLKDPTFENEEGCIRCFTKRFDDNEYLAEFRSPFNSRNNLGYLHNCYHKYFDRYFNFTEQIIAVNLIGTDFQSLNNGSDQDSDSLFVTNQKQIVEHAKYCYNNYLTIENNIPKEKNVYDNTMSDFAEMDNKLAAAQLDIGESSNIAQIGLSYTYNCFNNEYDDYIAILAVLAQAAIDNAKRTFDVNIRDEIRRIKDEMNVDTIGYPSFFGGIKPEVRNKINPNIDCPMNRVYRFKSKKVSWGEPIPMKDFFVNHDNTLSKRKSYKVEKLIEDFSIELNNYNIWFNGDKSQIYSSTDDYLLLRSDYDELISRIKGITLSSNYLGLMSWLLNRALLITPNVKGKQEKLESKLNKNRSLLVKVLYDINPKTFKKCFKNEPTSE